MKSVKGNESKVIATTLAVLMSISMLPVMAHAVSENTPKEEVVYINLNNDGSVEEINVVNIFELNENSEIVEENGDAVVVQKIILDNFLLIAG